MITKSDDTIYYQTTNNILAWQGICPTNIDDIFVIVGTLKTNFGAIYKGTIDIPDTSKIETITYPNSTSTQVYGPDYVSNCNDNSITLVGSYQTGTTGINEPCNGFGYNGAYNDFNNPNNYFTIENPLIPFKYTVVHSTRGGLAVYISSDFSQLNFIIGRSFLYDIDLKKTITEIKFPNSLFTTTYGIWYNGKVNCYDTYTISGGFSVAGFDNIQTFVVDLLYNKLTGEIFFENWTEIKIPCSAGTNIYTHAQGITGLDNCNYILPIANYYKDPSNINLIEFSGGKVEIKRFLNTFILVNYEPINYPNSNLTIVTSAAKNSVVGIFVNTNDEEFPFQAVTQ